MTISEAKIDNSLTSVMDMVDSKLDNMTVDEKQDFIRYLQGAIEDKAVDIEKEYKEYYN